MHHLGPFAHLVLCRPSTLRQLNHSLSDPKYTGRRVSRKQLEEDEEDEDIPSGSEAGNDELPEESGSEEEENEEETDGEGSEDERNGSSRIAPQATYRMSEIVLPPKPSKRRGEEPTDEGESPDLASSLRATREQDRKKGKAVTHQMVRQPRLFTALSNSTNSFLVSLGLFAGCQDSSAKDRVCGKPSTSRMCLPFHGFINQSCVK